MRIDKQTVPSARIPAARLAATCVLGLLAACGGGGGGGGGAQRLPSATLSTLQAAPATAPADGVTQVLLTALVRDTDGVLFDGVTVRFEATGTGALLDQAVVAANAGGVATTTLTSSQPGTVTIAAVVVAAGAETRLLTTATVDFFSALAPMVTGPARYEDRNGNAELDAGDAVVVRFSEAVAVQGAAASDFSLPVVDDTFGVGAAVSAGPGADEVTIELGDGARLRTRGLHDPGVVTGNAPSGIAVLDGQGIVSVANSVPAAMVAAVDIAPAPVERSVSSVVTQGQRIVRGDVDGNGVPDAVVLANGFATPLVNAAGTLSATGAFAATGAVDIDVSNLNRIGAAEALTAGPTGVQVWNNSAVGGGSPAFAAAAVVATGDTRAVLAVDVDADGFPDIVAGTSTGVTIAPHQRNLGNSYVLGQTVALGGPVLALAAADLDGDGDLDVVAAQDGGARRLRNDAGTLVDLGLLVQAGTVDVAIGDVDGDGRPDVVTVGGGTATAFANGAGAFVPTSFALEAERVLVDDVDGDAFADLLAVRANGIELLQNDRSGAFLSVCVKTGAGDAVAIDLDDDGDHDYVTTEPRVLEASRSGTFGDTQYAESLQLATDTAGAAQELVDVDGDAIVDRLVTTATGVDVWLGDGAGGFALNGSFGPSLPAAPTAIACGDFDGDGDADCVLGFDGANELFLNDGQGQFTFTWAFSPFNCRSLGLTDFDGDGDLDVFVGNDGDNEIFLNTPSGGVPQLFLEASAFNGVLPAARGGETIAVLVFDFDREGDEDIIVVNGGDLTSPQDAYVLRRSGAGYTLLNTLNAQLLATGATIADIDGDGREDLAIAQLSSNGSASIKWFRGNATSLSTLSTNVATNGQYFSRSLIVTDVNGDGRSDFVVGDLSVSNQPLAVIEQQANGTFQVGQEFPTTRLEQLGAGDFDRDGDVDLVTVETTGPSRVLGNR